MDFFSSLFADTSTATLNTSLIATLTEAGFIIFGTFLLSLFIAFVYQKTYTGKFYNHGFVQTLMILSVLIAMVMNIVGSNAAGAFTLMGVLSIIRFRNSLKDTRDIGFIFFAIAIGLAMGTGLYLFALVGTILVSILFYIIKHFSLFEQEMYINQTLKIYIPESTAFDTLFSPIFDKYTKNYELVGIMPMSFPGNTPDEVISMRELSFRISHKADMPLTGFLADIEKISGNNRTSLVASD